MAWLYLILAGILEIVWAYTMKQSDGFSKLIPSIITIVTMIISFSLLSLGMRSLPLGTSYMVWTGIGAVGSFIVGVIFLNEPANALRIIAACMIAGGLLMMKISSN